MKLKVQEKFWIGTYILLWLIVSSVSTIHSVEFFKLSNNTGLSWSLALAFELGAIASLGGLIISRGDKKLIWVLFIILTAFQIHCNMYWSWINAGNLESWINLLDLIDEDPDVRLRIFSAISGGILPIVALGFIKSLMDYLKPDKFDYDSDESVEGDTVDADETVDAVDADETVDVKKDEYVNRSNSPFWFNLNPLETLEVLRKSNYKLNNKI